MTPTRSAPEERALAEELDASGDHDGAINALARATGLGDIEAMTRLGKRLLVGRDAPFLPKQGTSFLVDAARKGGAEAPARLAVLAAAGVYLPQNLGEAFILLTTSAQRGWPPAQAQLRALAPDRSRAAAYDRTEVLSAAWRDLADTIDLGFWRRAPERRVLSDDPAIHSFPELLPGPVCEWLIAYSADRLQRALVYDAETRVDYASDVRTNSWAQFDLMECEFIHLLAQLRMEAACGLPLHHMEATAILHYAVGEQISDHYDFVDPNLENYEQEIIDNGQRVVTFLIYLNDEYDGGETHFPKLDITHRGTAGEGLCFANALADGEPDTRMLHNGRPPTRGEKWIVSQFIRNRRVFGFDG